MLTARIIRFGSKAIKAELAPNRASRGDYRKMKEAKVAGDREPRPPRRSVV